MEKINIASLLKVCPTGMELDCVMYDNLYFDYIREHAIYPIVCYTVDSKGEKHGVSFNWYGKHTPIDTAKCVIFPKGKTTWEGFIPPCQFKDGDIVYTKHKLGTEFVSIFRVEYERDICTYWDMNLSTNKLIGCLHDGNAFKVFIEKDKVKEQRFATEEEKQKLFKAFKDNGYTWNAETKTLDKLPKFKVGDWVTDGVSKCQIYFIDDTQYWYSENCILGSIESVDKQYHLWTIDDAKDGDVLFHSDSASNGIFIFKEILQRGTLHKVICYCDYDSEDGFCLGENHTCCWTDSKILHSATKERRDLLFQKIKEAGYYWNSETKTLEKLIKPKFKAGDKIRSKNKKDEYFHILHVDEDKYKYVLNIKGYCLEFKDQDNYELTNEPKFKVGDRIRKKGDKTATFTISDIGDLCYYCGEYVICNISYQDDYELVPNKFDINILKPLQPVLVRDSNIDRWDITFYELYDSINKIYPYRTLGGCIYKQCIPYEENEYLLGKTDDCNDFYKTWE